MVDFASVNLRITSPDGRRVIGELGSIDAAGQRMAKRMEEQTRRAAQQFERTMSMSARNIAANFAKISAEGRISGETLRSVAQEAGNVAMMFGPGSVIAGAVALTGVAIYNMFARTRKEIEETRKKFEQEVVTMVNAGDNAALLKRAQDLYVGTPGKGFKDGIKGLEDERLGIMASPATNVKWREQIADVEKRLKPLMEQFQAIQRAILDVNNTPVTIRGLPAISVQAMSLESMAKRSDDLAKSLERINGLGLPMPNVTGAPVGPRVSTDVLGMRMLDSVQAGITSPDISASLADSVKDAEWLQDWDRMVEGLGVQMGQSLSASISAGIETAIRTGDIGKGFQAVTGAMLMGLGEMAQTVGEKALVTAQLLAKLQRWLVKNPAWAIPVALGLIAFGAVLKGMGASMGGSGGVGGGFGGGYGGYGSGGGTIVDRGLINPLNPAPNTAGLGPAQPVQIHATIIGTDDARAQRQLLDMMDKALARRTGHGLEGGPNHRPDYVDWAKINPNR